MRAKPRQKQFSLRPRLRVLRGRETALGPGRIELLELIADAGSLRSAAEHMGMSYMKAWKIVHSLNRHFRPALVEIVRGGKNGGGAKVTATGQEVVRAYRRMEVEAEKAVASTWKGLRGLLQN